MNIETTQGMKEIRLRRFDALDGWEIQANYVKFAASSDKAFRREYTLEVLSYASVVVGEQTLPLSTDALIDNHLCSWQNVLAVFDAVLVENGINPETHADRESYWAKAGAELAAAFIASTTHMMQPAINAFEVRLQAATGEAETAQE